MEESNVELLQHVIESMIFIRDAPAGFREEQIDVCLDDWIAKLKVIYSEETILK